MQGWTELHGIALHWSVVRKIPIICESQWLRLGETVERQCLWMLYLCGFVSCLERAKRHCLLLNQDFLLNSLQQFPVFASSHQPDSRGCSCWNNFICCKSLSIAAGFGMGKAARGAESSWGAPGTDAGWATSWGWTELAHPQLCVAGEQWGRCVPSLLLCPLRSSARSSSGVAWRATNELNANGYTKLYNIYMPFTQWRTPSATVYFSSNHH